METTATLRGVRLSAQKGRLVADQVRGMPVGRALDLLTFSPKKGARIIKQVLLSAIANAEHNDGADIDELKVTTIYVDKADVLKRIEPARQGPRQRDQQAELSHPRRRRRRKQGITPWVRKSIPPGSALPSRGTGARKWFANSKNYAGILAQDIKVREYLGKKLSHASVAKITIERPAKNARITIHSARPGVVIGKKGEDIETLRGDLRKMMGGDVGLNIEEIRKPEIDAQLIADSIAQQLEKRIMFRRAMKRAMQNAMRLGAQGIKVMSSGRLNGAEIARREWYREGRVPLHTLRADIDYGFSEARTTYGVIGIKVWVFKGEVMAHNAEPAQAPAPAPETPKRPPRRTPPPGAKNAATS